MKSNPILTVIGTMSGTSCDGIDIAALRTDGETVFEYLGGDVFQYEKGLQERIIHSFASDVDIIEAALLEREITIAHAEAINAFLDKTGLNVDLIGFHGQTIRHVPDKHVSIQLGDRHLLAHMTRQPVINDFRRADIAQGGTGAPLVPIFHKELCKKHHNALILNIGGVMNVTYIKEREIFASDVSMGNAYMDDLVKAASNGVMQYDQDGMIASEGTANYDIINQWLGDKFFALPYPKSLDRNHFDVNILNSLELKDKLATIIGFIKEALAFYISSLSIAPEMIIVMGGGRHNKSILKALSKIGPKVFVIEDIMQIEGDLIEAYAFAYLAARSLYGLPISYPTTTGRQ